MEIGLLGPLRVTHDGDEIAVRGAKQRALIGILAVHAGGPVAADALIELIWGDDLPANPQNALQAQIANVRRTLGAGAIETIEATYSIRFDVTGSEIAAFERTAAEGRSAAAEGDHALAAARLAEALDLWRGPALADFAYEAWARPEITRLEGLRTAAIDARIDAELMLGRHAELVGEIEALLAQDRLHEHRWAQLMLALYRSGRQGDALRAAGEARRTLVDELGLDPGPELVQLEAQILDHQVEPAPQRRSSTSARTPLPTPITRFFGRDRELPAVTAAVTADDVRLVTLLGPGGAGKTRLALEVGRNVTATTASEAVLVALESVGETDAIVAAIGAALGVRPDTPAGATPTDLLSAISSSLSQRPTVMILDNCEHLITDVAHIAETLLHQCADLTILATSREGLGVAGEHLIPLGPLDPAAAAALFVDRAHAVRADASIDAGSAEVAVICDRVDGLPLALELAAARARSLPIGQIADRLAQRFRLLTGGSRTAVPRQQTLRAVVDWSYDLLFEDERVLFERLSVFAGGWTLAAAEEICADARLPRDAILDLLENLTDKSLVVVDTGSTNPAPRYRMLQTLAEYAGERLAERGDAERFRSAHARWFGAVGRAGSVGLTSSEARTWRARLDTDLDNLRTAFDWLQSAGSATEAVALSVDVGLLWWLRGDWAEGLRWADQASALCTAGVVDDAVPPQLAAMNDAWGAYYRVNRGGDPHDAVTVARTAVDELTRLDDERLTVTARVVLAAILSRQRDHELHAAAADAMAAAEAIGDPWFLGVSHGLMALHHIRAGDLDGASASATTSIELLDSVGDRAAVFEARSVLLTVAQLAGRLDEAETLVEQMSEAACDAQVPHYEEWCCTRMGLLRTARGDVAGGEELHRSALAIGADPWADAHAHLGLAVCARRCGQLPTAREHCDRALTIHDRVGAAIESAYIHLVRAWIEIDDGRHDEALRLAELAEATAPTAPPAGPAPVAAMAAEIRAAAAAAEDDHDGAARSLAAARELATVVGHAAWWLTRDDVAELHERVGRQRGHSPTSARSSNLEA